MSKLMMAGAMICKRRILQRTSSENPIDSNVIICPTSPLVPMPAPDGLFVNPNQTDAKGARTAPATVGGIIINGFLIMLATCNIDVRKPCANSPPMPLSRYLETAKPIICAEQPTAAAPAANPANESMRAIATLEIGAVNAHPIKTATRIPIINAYCSVDQLIICPNHTIIVLMGAQINVLVKNPTIMVTSGVTIISTRVVLYTTFPHSVANKAAT